MKDVQALNDFVQNYYNQLAVGVYGKPMPLTPGETALILIDVQQCLTQEYYAHSFQSFGMDVDALEPILRQIGENLNQTLDHIEKILTKCREKGILPIHIKIESYLPDAKDTGALHASAGMFYPPGSPEAAFIPQAAPLPGEIVLRKTCSGIHVGTPVDGILRNLGIRNVIVVGFYTDQCVSTSVRDLSDLGYKVDLIEDAVGAMSPQRQEFALQSIKKIYANSESTAELLRRLEDL